MRKVTTAFDNELLVLPLKQLLPMRKVTDAVRGSEKYQTIKASLQTVGLIEPLVVFPQKDRPDQYLLLDGAIRLDIFNTLGVAEALCLVATDDETYTYNHKVSQVSPIQEHFMILKTIGMGVPEEIIAETLHVDVAAIRRKRDLLVGVCEEVVSMLRDKRVSPAALREIKRVVALRQIEMAEFHLDRITRIPNTLNAHRLIWSAQKHDKQDAVVEALFKAYFVDGVDIGEPRNLVAIAVAAGIEKVTAEKMLATDEGLKEVVVEEEQFKAMEIEGVPSFVVGGVVLFSGAAEPQVMVEAFRLHRASGI